MEKQANILKTFEPIKCPFCGKESYISIESSMSRISSISTFEDIIKAKKKIKERLNEINFYSEKDKQEVIAYLDNEETVVDMSDVDRMVKQVALEQINKKQQNG